MSTRVKLVGPLVVWTVFVWASRIRNIWTDDSLATGGQVVRTVIAAVFLAFAVVTARMLWVRKGESLNSTDRLFLGGFVIWTIGFWLVRGIGIIVDDHTASFTAVHTVLMIISIGIALLASQVLRSSASISSSRAVAQ